MMRYYTYLNVKYGYVNNHDKDGSPIGSDLLIDAPLLQESMAK